MSGTHVVFGLSSSVYSFFFNHANKTKPGSVFAIKKKVLPRPGPHRHRCSPLQSAVTRHRDCRSGNPCKGRSYIYGGKEKQGSGCQYIRRVYTSGWTTAIARLRSLRAGKKEVKLA